ncbi:MerR family transcriptional regulator [Limosilactobacillus fermentum]|nr:MerR family transcriptional regulator [Limosilactobacillus fermentum]MCO8300923.1 MerR family transcriptional regulator [Limosilactobacillus fermentum]
MAYTIGQASAKLNISIDTIRYYDKQGLLPFVSRTKNGRRSFTENDLHLMRTIICLKNAGVPVAEIAEFRRGSDPDDALLASQGPRGQLEKAAQRPRGNPELPQV